MFMTASCIVPPLLKYNKPVYMFHENVNILLVLDKVMREINYQSQ